MSVLRVSAIVAVGLWLVATLAELALEPAPRQAEPAALDEAGERPAESRQENLPAALPASCPAVEENLETLVQESGSCATDDDCTLFDYGYPIDCMTSIAKAAIPGLRTAYRQYDQSCEHRLFYDCPTEPFVRVPVCRNNRCAVELFRNGDPEGRTLQRNDDPSPADAAMDFDEQLRRGSVLRDRAGKSL